MAGPGRQVAAHRPPRRGLDRRTRDGGPAHRPAGDPVGEPRGRHRPPRRRCRPRRSRSCSPAAARAITAEAERRITAYEASIGRPANNLERTRIAQAATLATRRGKTHESENSHEIARTLARPGLAAGRRRPDPPAPTSRPRLGPASGGRRAATATARRAFSPEAVAAQALEACHGPDGKSTFTRHDLLRQLDLALPANLGALLPGRAAQLLDELADAGPGPRRRRPGRRPRDRHRTRRRAGSRRRRRHRQPVQGAVRHPRSPRRRDGHPAQRRRPRPDRPPRRGRRGLAERQRGRRRP